MSELRDKLDALLKNRQLMTGSQWAKQHNEVSESRRTGSFEIDDCVPGAVQGEADDGFYLVRTDFPLTHPQGNLALGDIFDCAGEHIALSAADDELADFDPRSACFVDTETIGLAGGTGTVAFLVGVGYFTEAGFRLDQCFMRDYDDEESMLRFLAERFSECDCVVGYNSKSFDLPLLRTRFIQNRIPFHGEAVPHYDLVHAARRFYKRRLRDCSLGNIEREVLGVRRKGDVPSHLIPQMWFDYLRTRDARRLPPVFYHHRMDILSLVVLTAWLSRCLDSPEGGGFEHQEDKLSLVRLHFRQKKYEDVIACGLKYIEEDEQSPLRRECLEMLCLAFRRRERFEELEQHLDLMLSEHPSDLFAHHELAKYHEHRSRNLPRAAAICKSAIALFRSPEIPEAKAFAQRLARIKKKLGRSGRDHLDFTA